VYNGETDPLEKVYSSYWLKIIDRLVEEPDLRHDAEEVGYYLAIKDLIEPSRLSQADFAELYQDLRKQDMSTVTSFVQNLAKDIELEDEELDVKIQLSLVEPYKYLNAESLLKPFAKSARSKSNAVLTQVPKIVEKRGFADTVLETAALYSQYPL
jgi:hypothetical protein